MEYLLGYLFFGPVRVAYFLEYFFKEHAWRVVSRGTRAGGASDDVTQLSVLAKGYFAASGGGGKAELPSGAPLHNAWVLGVRAAATRRQHKAIAHTGWMRSQSCNDPSPQNVLTPALSHAAQLHRRSAKEPL